MIVPVVTPDNIHCVLNNLKGSMRETAYAFTAVLALSLGALAASGSDSREVKIGRSEALALQDLGRRSQELETVRLQWDAAMKKLQADTAEIHSEIRTRYGVLQAEEFQRIDPEKLLLTVGQAKAGPPAPVGTR